MKNVIILFLTIMFLLFPVAAYGGEITYDHGSFTGTGGYSSTCGGSYCHNKAGLRISLYKYEGSNSATKIGRSHDYWKTQTSTGNSTMSDPKDNGSKNYYSSLVHDDLNDKKQGGSFPTSGRFNISADVYKSYGPDMVSYLDATKWKYDFKINTENAKFRQWLENVRSNAIFQTLDEYDELKINLDIKDENIINDIKSHQDKYYLIAEIIGGIYSGSASFPSGFGGKNDFTYNGTVYELGAFASKTHILSDYFAMALISTNPVGEILGGSSSNVLKYASGSVNIEDIRKNTAVGMAVFRLSDVIQEKTCSDVCGGKSGESLLECAENFCDPDSPTSADKEICINTCGYNEPAKLSCGTSTTVAPETFCSEKTTAKKMNTLQSDSGYTFYNICCEESTTAMFSDDLPVILSPTLGGFNYSVKTTGNKKCTFTFNVKRLQYEYAILKRNETTKRNSLIDKIKYFKTIDDKNVGNYKYEFDDLTDKIELFVPNTISAGLRLKRNQDFSKTSDYTYTKTNSKTAHFYGLTNKSVTTDTVKNFTTTNTELFELPQKCYSLKTGKITPAIITGSDVSCGTGTEERNIAYYGYYSFLKDAKVNTKTEITKPSSGSFNDNKCYYNNGKPEDDFSCSILAEKTSTDKYKITYKTTKNRNGASLYTYMFDGSISMSETAYKTITLNEGKTVTIKASITLNGVTKTCPITITNKGTPIGEKCTEKFKPTEYDAIRQYCNKNWKTDLEGYNSYADCYNSCSSRGRESCKSKFKCNQTVQIESYCNSNYAADGYKSVAACINDCNCKGEIGEYFYRPISIVNPFPGYGTGDTRNPGINWKGFTEYITDETKEGDSTNFTTGKAEYVVKLDLDTIKAIRSDTNLEKDALGYTGTYSSGVYKSDFIKSSNGFICIAGFGECD